MAYQLIYNNKFMTGFNSANPPMTEVGTLAGKSIKIMNMTQYGLSVYAAGSLLDYIPAYQFLIMENRSDLYVQLDGVNTVPYVYPNANVAVKTIDDKLPYSIGILIQTQQPGDVQNISGNVNMNGTVNANIQNTPAVTISGGVQATIENATLNSNVTNASIGTTNTIMWGPSVNTITNLAAGASINFINRITPANTTNRVYVDAVTFVVQNAASFGYPGSNYQLAFHYMAINGYVIPDSHNETVLTVTGGQFEGYSQTIKFDSPRLCGDFIDMSLKNMMGSAIASDTVTVYAYLHYSQSFVNNPSNNPIPTTGNYYGTGKDGTFNSTGSVNLNNPAGAAAIYNYSSFTINSGHTIGFANTAKYVLIYCTGDVTINGTLNAAPGVTNLGAPAQPLTLNGKTVPNCGNGGNGGAGGWSGGAGGTGGTGNCYVAGCGGGGGGGFNGGAGASYGTGYGTAAGGSGASYNGVNGNAGGSATTWNSATLCIVAGGTITINGTIFAPGYNGGNGGAGVYNSTNNVSLGGGGGACGSDAGGGGSYQTGVSNTGGGGGAGGSGGAAVFLFSGGPTLVSGTINTNAGGGGTGGSGNGGNGTNGQAGQAGGISIYQMGGTAGGL